MTVGGTAVADEQVDTSLLVDVLSVRGARGATAADGFLIEERSFSASCAWGSGTAPIRASSGWRFACFSGRASAAASTSDLCATRIRARGGRGDRARALTAEDRTPACRESELIDQSPTAAGNTRRSRPRAEDRGWRGAEAAALAADPRITNSEGADFRPAPRYAYATSHLRARLQHLRFGLTVSPSRRRTGDAARRLVSYARRRRRSRIRSRSAARRARARAPARCAQGEDGRGAGDLDPDMAASLLRSIAGTAAGPACTARLVLLSVSARACAPTVTIVDDACCRAARLAAVRREGLATRRTCWSRGQARVVTARHVLRGKLGWLPPPREA